MVYVVAKKIIKKENQPAFLELAKDLIACTRKEEGCIEYTLTATPEHENLLMYIEKWESRAHLDAHLQSEHMLRLRPLMNPLCDDASLLILQDAYDLAGL